MDFAQLDIPSVQELLRSGYPFAPFSEFSIQTLDQPGENFHQWIENKLHEGKPFVIRGFNKKDEWRKAALNKDTLVSLSTSEAIPVRNCQTGRDVKMRLRDLLSQTDYAHTGNIREFLYAKDLHCPTKWVRALETTLPSSLKHLGSLDLFRVLPEHITPEVLMAYVGTRKSFSGFHRCFSATVALNLLIESEGSGPGSICFGTDTNSQAGYDAFMEELGKSPHTDWANVSINKLRSADFPIYVTDQTPGDLVVFPTATAHQIWNISPLVTKVVWNILHASSLASFFDYVQPAYQRQCHTDTGRVPLIPMHALRNDLCGKQEMQILLEVFQQLVEDEDTGRELTVSVKTVDTQGAVVECNFCGLTIWNRHLHCEQCGDFDLCLMCFVSGRSCKHFSSYTWAEMLPRERCQEILQTTRGRIGKRTSLSSQNSKRKSLGAIALAAVDARKQPTDRLCHLCRDNHPEWKGVSCPQCSAFFCFRGLHRHFDIDLMTFLRSEDPWLCPKCSHVCNCRCCHFSQPYQSKSKPVRARIKPIDSRGRNLGFVDNVFDQRRGKRASLVAVSSASPHPAQSPRGSKRSRMLVDEDGQAKSLRSQDTGRSTAFAHVAPTRITRPEAPDYYSASTPPPTCNPANSTLSRTPDSSGQLRSSSHHIEDRAPTEIGLLSQSRQSQHVYVPAQSVPLAEGTPGGHNPSRITSSKDEESIGVLEKKLEALRRYADDVLELSLIDSHATILERISQLETQIEQRKRRKAEELFTNLNRDFPDLENLAREEARRRGL